jgi:uncharacterized lipoprotein YajG
MSRLKSPAAIGEILSQDPIVLTRVVFLAAEVRKRQKAYFANRGAPNALELLTASKEHERLLDVAIDAITLGGRPAQPDLLA